MELKIGEIVEGKVKSLTKFGAFILLPDGTTGMVHISEVANCFVGDIHDFLKEGDTVKAMVIRSENGKINLSIKKTLAPVAPKKQFDRRPERSAQNRFTSNRPAPMDAKPQQKSFDDMVKAFMTESDSKISSVRQYSEHKTKTRKR